MVTTNEVSSPAELHAAASQAVDEALAELAALPKADRYQADLRVYGTPEGAFRAAAVRALDAQRLLQAVKGGD